MQAKAPVTAINSKASFLINALTRQISTMFGGIFGGDAKHTRMYADYGYPETISIEDYHRMYLRNGLAAAGINHAIESCWPDYPVLVEKEDTHDLTAQEKAMKKEFDRLQFWSVLSEADRYSRIGEYGGVIFRYRDSKRFDQPVNSVSGGLVGIAEVIPVMQTQLKPSTYYTDVTKENYGQVAMYTFNESDMQGSGDSNKMRQFNVHPDRVHIWSKNSTVWGTRPVNESGYNDLLTMQKIIGAGGEGFWKNAKAAILMNASPEAPLQQLATMMGVPLSDLPDKLDEIYADFNKGLDTTMLMQGIETKTAQVTLPDPEKFFLVALQSYVASINEPMKIFVGSQSGERASTEDAKMWNKTNNSRRSKYVKPNIMRIIERWVQYKILPANEWYLLWADLTESTTEEKVVLADKMSTITERLSKIGEQGFTGDEIREVAGWAASKEPVIKRKSTDRKIDPNETD